jgi:hypothetical protein
MPPLPCSRDPPNCTPQSFSAVPCPDGATRSLAAGSHPQGQNQTRRAPQHTSARFPSRAGPAGANRVSGARPGASPRRPGHRNRCPRAEKRCYVRRLGWPRGGGKEASGPLPRSSAGWLDAPGYAPCSHGRDSTCSPLPRTVSGPRRATPWQRRDMAMRHRTGGQPPQASQPGSPAPDPPATER